ncbi:hypothetical protein EYF80_032202 [Liparis tanakae]|uniref:Uncharacterized protein n=1 Tax=Liparis tanakae TaxID=230148 RepID=A0A4Z2GWH2_9TELE|nr:hypothetical protein EYF80_032202 [Liparis tanakae]
MDLMSTESLIQNAHQSVDLQMSVIAHHKRLLTTLGLQQDPSKTLNARSSKHCPRDRHQGNVSCCDHKSLTGGITVTGKLNVRGSLRALIGCIGGGSVVEDAGVALDVALDEDG